MECAGAMVVVDHFTWLDVSEGWTGRWAKSFLQKLVFAQGWLDGALTWLRAVPWCIVASVEVLEAGSGCRCCTEFSQVGSSICSGKIKGPNPFYNWIPAIANQFQLLKVGPLCLEGSC